MPKFVIERQYLVPCISIVVRGFKSLSLQPSSGES
jgi:hypothetical protein